MNESYNAMANFTVRIRFSDWIEFERYRSLNIEQFLNYVITEMSS